MINGRLEQAGLKPVSFNTVKSRLWKHWTAEEVARRRGDRTAVRKHRRRGGALVPDHPLQVCQIDETEIDVLAVDDAGNLLRRLWVIVLVDVLTHMILGFWLWPRSANREAIGLCVQHAIRPKGAYFQKFGIEATDVFGRPERIISDRAAWYKSLQDNRSLEDLRVVVEPRRGEPHIRGVVERLQGSINQQLRKGRGQTGRSVADRGDYPAKERACLTYEQIETAVAITAFRICNGEMDEKTRKRPDLEWAKHACRIPEHLLTVDWEAVHRLGGGAARFPAGTSMPPVQQGDSGLWSHLLGGRGSPTGRALRQPRPGIAAHQGQPQRRQPHLRSASVVGVVGRGAAC